VGETIPANSFNLLTSVAERSFIDSNPGGIDLKDVFALLVALQNPGVPLNQSQIANGINAILAPADE